MQEQRIQSVGCSCGLRVFSDCPDSFRDAHRAHRIIRKVLPNLRNRFYASKPCGAYLQVYNVAIDQTTQNPDISALFRVERGGKQVKYWSEDAGQSIQFFSERRLVLAKSLPLVTLPPAQYVLQVEIEDRLYGDKVERKQKFEIAPEPVAGSE